MAKRKSKNANPTTDDPLATYRAIAWVLLAGVWLLLVVALASYHPADPPAPAHGVPNDPPQNLIGAFGAHVAHQVYFMLGPGAWLIIAAVAAYLVTTARRRTIAQLPLRAVGIVVMALTISAIAELGSPLMLASEARTPGAPGGWLAVLANDQLTARFARPGTAVILFVTFWIGALLAVDELVLVLPRALGRCLMALGAVKHVPRPALAGVAGRMASLRVPWRRGADTADAAAGRTERKRRRRHDEPLVIDEDAGGVGGTEAFDPDEAAVATDGEDDE
ncbi:MAG: DNA translocase FtsK 4TM domain-containing protein, partial [Phycisphaeraceae bacterium]